MAIVRPATPDDRAAVANVLDGAALAVEDDRLKHALADESVLVAVASETDAATGPPILGALVLDGQEIVAVAVRPRRRGQGIGTALVEAAADRRDRLVAKFDPRAHVFWAEQSFAIEPADAEDRLRGVRPPETRGSGPNKFRF